MGLERLCRYAGRPPVAIERLSLLPDGRLLYRLKLAAAIEGEAYAYMVVFCPLAEELKHIPVTRSR
jgi:hypothetical protein